MEVIRHDKPGSNGIAISESTSPYKNAKNRRSSKYSYFTTIFLVCLIVGLTRLLVKKNASTSVTIPSLDNDHPSRSSGFNPVYVYSNARTTRKPPEKPTYSQAKQDMIAIALTKANDAKLLKANIRSTVKRERKFFVDLASNDALTLSNTYLLEQNEWNGICLEPNPIYWYNLASFRTCTIIGAFVGGKQEDDGKEIDAVLSNGIYGGIVGKEMDNKDKTKLDKVKRNLVSILTIFQETNVPKVIDYFSLDVEGAETLVMKDFPWDIYKFKFLTIERPTDELKIILTSNGYSKLYDLTSWGETLWFHEKSVYLTKEDIDVVMNEKDYFCVKCVNFARRYGPDYQK